MSQNRGAVRLAYIFASLVSTTALLSNSYIPARVEAEDSGSDEIYEDYDIHKEMKAWGYSGGGFVNRSVDRRPVNRSYAQPPRQRTIYFFAHHKTGTVLAQRLAQNLARLLGHTSWRVNPRSRPSTLEHCTRSVLNLQTLDAPQLNHVFRGCPDFVAVHFVRDPVELLVSGYMYHRRVDDRIPFLPGAPTPDTYRNKSVREGLVIEAQAEMRSTIRDMLNTLAIENSHSTHPVLPIDLGDIFDNFEPTIRRLYTHLVGDDAAMVGELVALARDQDPSTHQHIIDPGTKAEHITPPASKLPIRDALNELLDERQVDVQALVSASARLQQLLHESSG